MKILHVAPHLGGGVGKAHAALAEAAQTASHDAGGIHHSYVLLEQPRDMAFAERVRGAGCDLHVVPGATDLAALAAEADIVQIEWWNHPRLYGLLAADILPPMRLVLWTHISGLAAPVIPLGLVQAADRILFTAPCSLTAANLQSEIRKRAGAFGIVGSGFGFENVRHRGRPAGAPLRCGYLGTLDFVKLHPDMFNFLDALDVDVQLRFWGRHDPVGPVAERAHKMCFPERVRFEGYAEDAAHVCADLDLFIYLLRPSHYGTGENALVEAMSAGAVPIVWDNPAETSIVSHGVTGFVVRSEAEFVACLADVATHPAQLGHMSLAAQADVADRFGVSASLRGFAQAYQSAMEHPKRPRRFADVLGRDARTWFATTMVEHLTEAAADLLQDSARAAKGSLAHFRACFPDDASLLRPGVMA